jgi:hypothetical protein
MIKQFKQWLADRHKKSEIALFNKGYAYATQELLLGRPFEQLEMEAANPFDQNSFDDGILAAVQEKVITRKALYS